MTESRRLPSPTRSEIIDQAVAEGHDADIPTTLGSIHQISRQVSRQTHDEKSTYPPALDKDLEKGDDAGSLFSQDEPEEQDSNIVDFDGPDDPENPLNWKASKKWGMVALISAITFLTPLASSIFAPGVPQVMETFHSTNDMLAGFMISVYVLGQYTVIPAKTLLY